jgi:DNA-binding transcriptional ArsR family regulator
MTAKKPLPAPCCSPAPEAAEPCCPPRPALQDRPLLDYQQADRLAGLFKVLANDTRLRLLHALIAAGEMAVTDLAATVAMKTQAVSNQLQRLHDWGIVACRREGTSIRYWIADCCVPPLLDLGLCLMEDARK